MTVTPLTSPNHVEYWDANPDDDIASGAWLSEEEKESLAANKTTFLIATISKVHKVFRMEAADIWDLDILINGNEPRILSLGCNEKRDPIIERMIEHLAERGPIASRLVKIKPSKGNAFWGLARPVAEAF